MNPFAQLGRIEKQQLIAGAPKTPRHGAGNGGLSSEKIDNTTIYDISSTATIEEG